MMAHNPTLLPFEPGLFADAWLYRQAMTSPARGATYRYRNTKGSPGTYEHRITAGCRTSGPSRGSDTRRVEQGALTTEEFRASPDVALVIDAARLLHAAGADFPAGVVRLAQKAAEQTQL